MSYRITRNAFKADIVGTYSDTDTVIELSSVTGLPDPSSVGNYNVILYDTLFGNPADARNGGSYEIWTVTDITGNDLTVLRGQEDTTAITITDRPFAVLYGATSGWLEDVLDDIDSKAPLIESSTTFQVGSGGDYATLNEAIEDVSKFYPVYKSTGVRVTLNMVAGFEMEEQVLVDGIDLSWITITGTDATTTIIRSALDTEFEGRFPAFGGRNGAYMPVINQLFNMNTSGSASTRDFLYIIRGVNASLLSSAGCTNAGDHAMRVEGGSNLSAQNCDFSNAANRTILCVNGSISDLIGSDLGGADVVATNTAMIGARNSSVSGDPITVVAGGIISCVGMSGSPSLSQTANTLTSNGIIFQ